jgi:regulator of replication initiation timing
LSLFFSPFYINIRPDEIADERLAEVICILFQLIEDLSEENEKLKAENQKLRDAINLLKGEQAKPDTKPSRKKPNEDISSEEERKPKNILKKKKSKAKKHKKECFQLVFTNTMTQQAISKRWIESRH